MDSRGSTVYLLCGLTGAGKTTMAQRLVTYGCERLSVDQVIHERYGRQDEDFPSGDYLRLHEQVIAELDERLVECLDQGSDVVLDYGLELWTRVGRDRYKQLVEARGGRWKLIYLPADRGLLLERLGVRNRRRDANAFQMTEERLDQFIAQFEEPGDEMQIVQVQHRGASETREDVGTDLDVARATAASTWPRSWVGSTSWTSGRRS